MQNKAIPKLSNHLLTCGAASLLSGSPKEETIIHLSRWAPVWKEAVTGEEEWRTYRQWDQQASCHIKLWVNGERFRKFCLWGGMAAEGNEKAGPRQSLDTSRKRKQWQIYRHTYTRAHTQPLNFFMIKIYKLIVVKLWTIKTKINNIYM